MSMTVQAVYPVIEGATFDYDYYVSKHLPLVREHFGPHGMTEVQASRGLALGSEAAPPYFAIATMTFPDGESMAAALGAAEPVLADIANFTTSAPNLLVGERIF
jgi:uncharacterized protein (TIGR02118 family)